ncbi:phosphatidylinositol N-acetylglucosaminyltransferase subunit Q [Scaptodrosophila lebanonensis]|uniref:Phosphatidylinositol N-acetylglucosaminyltransferase subunit Q n=1 Tax=Drosophila lebanonensis TaxID=7225 RepID=A0A6J2TUT7_DROLE|nr:phosphatidylinositol N-acetylglucosaminyltransferase subunit Q [Scaptodrosophila lebanonensis]
MSIKIFMPTEYFYIKRPINLYGQVQISDDNVVVYYIVDDEDFSSVHKTTCKMRFLGSIVCSDSNDSHYYHDMNICFVYNALSPTISLTYLGITPESLSQVKLLLYDKSKVRNLVSKGEGSSENCLNNDCDFLMLTRLIKTDSPPKSASHISQPFSTIANIPTKLFNLIVENRLFKNIMTHTVLYKNSQEWQIAYTDGSRFTNIVVDRVMGIALMLILFMLISHPGDFLIQISHGIIDQLYSLLKVLEGSPIGLKLNIHLNNFFLDCFKYHIELWSTFLDLIEPIVRQLFHAIGVLGCLGFSYQIALLADLISIVGLHAHCFYVYTKVLYNVEVKGLRVLWQVVRGKRTNILKGRIESHNYMNRQLYLATIFFSGILFLFPTTFIYYSVFAALKSLTFITITILELFRLQLLQLPIDNYLKRINNSFFEIECIKVRDLPDQQSRTFKHENYNIHVFVFTIGF